MPKHWFLTHNCSFREVQIPPKCPFLGMLHPFLVQFSRDTLNSPISLSSLWLTLSPLRPSAGCWGFALPEPTSQSAAGSWPCSSLPQELADVLPACWCDPGRLAGSLPLPPAGVASQWCAGAPSLAAGPSNVASHFGDALRKTNDKWGQFKEQNCLLFNFTFCVIVCWLLEKNPTKDLYFSH